MSVDIPNPDQINAAVTHTSVAVNAVKVAWSDWAPIISALSTILFVQVPAMSKGLQNVPVLGPLWNTIAGNWGAAKNKP